MKNIANAENLLNLKKIFREKGAEAYFVGLYVRLSTEDGDKEESNSIGNQIVLLKNYVEKSEDLILEDIYIDDGYTGTNFERPGFQRMLEDIKNKRINCIIVKDLSRFGRDYITTGMYLERYFPSQNIRFIALTDNVDSKKQSYDMLLPIKNVFNEQYARDISKKIKTSVISKQVAGKFIGAFCSYGYQKDPVDKNRLIIDEEVADVITRIFTMFSQGHGKQEIAKVLNSEGIPCPAEYKKLKGYNYKNVNRLESTHYWTYSTINSILRKEIYIGNMVQGTKSQEFRKKQKQVPRDKWIIVKNTHEPLVDIETWNKVQSLINKKTKAFNKKDISIFAGYLKCGECGRSLVKHGWKKVDGTRVISYHCGTYKRMGRQFCTPQSISHNLLEKIVLEDLNKQICKIENMKEIVDSVKLADHSREKLQKNIERLKSKLEKTTNGKRRLYQDLKDELISKEEYLIYRQDYIEKEEETIKQLNLLEEKKNNESPLKSAFQHPWIQKLIENKKITNLDRSIIIETINKITLFKNERIEITYTYIDELIEAIDAVNDKK